MRTFKVIVEKHMPPILPKRRLRRAEVPEDAPKAGVNKALAVLGFRVAREGAHISLPAKIRTAQISQ